jgi:hypothetical protein
VYPPNSPYKLLFLISKYQAHTSKAPVEAPTKQWLSPAVSGHQKTSQRLTTNFSRRSRDVNASLLLSSRREPRWRTKTERLPSTHCRRGRTPGIGQFNSENRYEARSAPLRRGIGRAILMQEFPVGIGTKHVDIVTSAAFRARRAGFNLFMGLLGRSADGCYRGPRARKPT